MADSTTKIGLKVWATISERVKELTIKDGQLIFVKDKRKIAFDIGGKRRFYNQVEILADEDERLSIAEPDNEQYYFVISTAVLWQYHDEWVQLTTPPEEILFVGTELPELGSANKLYIDKTNKEVSVWDDDDKQYVVVADKMDEITESEIDEWFE